MCGKKVYWITLSRSLKLRVRKKSMVKAVCLGVDGSNYLVSALSGPSSEIYTTLVRWFAKTYWIENSEIENKFNIGWEKEGGRGGEGGREKKKAS